MPPPQRDALEGKAPQRRPQKPFDRRLEEVVKAVGGGYRRLQMPLTLALAVREMVAGHRLGALEGGAGYLRSFQCIPPPPPPPPHNRIPHSGLADARAEWWPPNSLRERLRCVCGPLWSHCPLGPW